MGDTVDTPHVHGNSERCPVYCAVPNRNVAGTSVAFSGESAYGQMLHDALAQQNIHVGLHIIPGAIGGGDPLSMHQPLLLSAFRGCIFNAVISVLRLAQARRERSRCRTRTELIAS